MSQNHKNYLEDLFKFLFKVEFVIIIFVIIASLLIWYSSIFFDFSHQSLENKIEIVKTIATIFGGAVVFINIYYTGKQKEASEKSAIAAIQKAQTEEEKQITERYSKAVEQLGHEEIYIQIGAIYALERIAKDSDKDYWQIIEILTAYIREKSPYISDKSEPIKLNIQAALTVIGRRSKSYKQGEENPIDLTGANLKGANLENANLEGANLKRVNLEDASLENANLSNANLENANLSNANFRNAHLEKVKLKGAKLRKVKFINVKLNNTSLSSLYFFQSDFQYANLSGSDFSYTWLKEVDFQGADLSNSVLVYIQTWDDEELDNNYELVNHIDEDCVPYTTEHLYETNFKDANLQDADLKYANLKGAYNLTPEQVKLAKNWDQAIYTD